jgi:hypothetical protein
MPSTTVVDFAEPSEWMKGGEAAAGRRVMHGDPDDSEGHRVDPDPGRGVLDRQPSGSRLPTPPFIRATSAEGRLLLARSTMLVLMLTMWPSPWVTTCWMAASNGMTTLGS